MVLRPGPASNEPFLLNRKYSESAAPHFCSVVPMTQLPCRYSGAISAAIAPEEKQNDIMTNKLKINKLARNFFLLSSDF